MNRILVIKLSDIGDVLTATPALRALRETYPAARIEVLVPPNSQVVLRGSRLVDEVLVFDKFAYDAPADAFTAGALRDAFAFFRRLRACRYDALVLLHHLSTRWGALKWRLLAGAVGAPVRAGLDNGRGGFLTHKVRDGGFGARHEVEHCLAVAEALGATATDRSLDVPIEDGDGAAELVALPGAPARAEGTESALRMPLAHRAIAIHPGSGGTSTARRWPLERWERLGQVLLAAGARVLIVGTEGDGGNELARRLPAALNLTGKTTLPQLASVLRRCDLFVGADSGVMHLACAAGTRVVALFGTTNANAWGPWTAPGFGAVVASETPGCPCAYVGFRVRSPECEARACMEGISVQRVLQAMDGLLGGGAPGDSR